MNRLKINIARWFEHAKSWIHSHPAKTYAFAAIGLILAGSITTAALLWQKPEARTTESKSTEKVTSSPKVRYFSKLTGSEVPNEAATTTPVTAIMLENSPDARPQSGLKDAEVVFEAVAEGGITRFLALYQQNKPQLVGPVRSVRLYYVDWLTPFDASVAHIGGSAAALKLVRNGQYRDIDQFFNARTYWRATDRYAPHNVYTSFERIDALNLAKGYTNSKPVTFDRVQDTSAAPTQDATSVSLSISGPTYNSTYAYDPATKLYARSQAGAPHLDRESGQITARVIVALRVNMSKILEDGYRENITTTGSGEAMIFQDGHASSVTWTKTDRTDQLKFTSPDGTAFKLAQGTTWISAIPTSGGNVSWK